MKKAIYIFALLTLTGCADTRPASLLNYGERLQLIEEKKQICLTQYKISPKNKEFANCVSAELQSEFAKRNDKKNKVDTLVNVTRNAGWHIYDATATRNVKLSF